MNKRIASITAAATLFAGGAAGAAVLVPGVGFAADATSSPPASSAPTAQLSVAPPFAAALKGLVEKGTITQAQADAVAQALASAQPQGWSVGGKDHGPARKGEVFTAAAKAIGLDVEDLRAELAKGKTLAQVAAEHDVTAKKVADAIAAEMTKRLDEELAAGRLTKAQADSERAEIGARAADMVAGKRPAGRHAWRDGPSHVPAPAPSGSAGSASYLA